MATLSRELRRSLESTVRAARRAAEAGAQKALEELAVNHHEPWPHMTAAQRELRNRLRAHGRQLGDRREERRGLQAIDHLTSECAYEHWHRMLFARYLAETELLIEPQTGVAISLAECEELARAEGRDWIDVAADYAQRMLPQIFRVGDPVLEVSLPPETRSAVEDLMKALPQEVFVADDSLGWVYQYWQADRKEEINHSEDKIGANELPAVTQLFTEDYMVLFLLHNTLGAWWAGKVLAAHSTLAESAASESEIRAACAVGDVQWTYLRFVREGEKRWRPAAGTFDGWPKSAKEITLVDPCMGSGHFLVFALPMLTAMRAEEESLSPEASVEAVLRDNLFGLEIDPRCTQIAAFNLALAAWRRIGYRQLPALHVACSGLSLGVTKAEWLKLAERVAQASAVPPKAGRLGTEENLFSDAMKRGFERLYNLFIRAPWLGSLIDPRSAGGDLIEHGFADLEPTLNKVLTKADSAELSEMAVAAQGLAKAAQILAGSFTLVATNVPYLGRGKQDEVLRTYCDSEYPTAKSDLATCLLKRCASFCKSDGTAAVVTPQSWLFMSTYKSLRRQIVGELQWNMVARLGSRAFEAISGEVVNVVLAVFSNTETRQLHQFSGCDVTTRDRAQEKALHLTSCDCLLVPQLAQLGNPDARIVFEIGDSVPLLSLFCTSFLGLGTGDYSHYGRCFWEFPELQHGWTFQQCSVQTPMPWGGREHVLAWDTKTGRVRGMTDGERAQIHNQDQSGQQAWGRRGVAIGLMQDLRPTLYSGEPYEKALAVLIPSSVDLLPALWAYCTDPVFNTEVRKLEHNVIVANGTLVKVPFDLARWKQVASQKYPSGLPPPYSSDPTQWLFIGQPKDADTPLHVAVARLLGYRWPRQTGSSFSDCPALGADSLIGHADHDGIVTLNPVKGERPAAARLIALLADAFAGEWSASKLDGLLSKIGFGGKTLDEWLRDGFFEHHCALFHQRPFIWHIWDGRRDGFHALVNYHRLAAPNGEGRRTLEKLLYSYLGDWIDRQRSDQKAGVEGADARVAAAEQLRSELTNILAGEPPYDIFVRWKPLHNQPIGWDPDANDGVRINIRPFINAKPIGARARACILRTTPRIKWEKDRGKEPQRPRDDFPWFWGWDEHVADFQGTERFDGSRWNDLHYTRIFKEAARARAKK